MERFCPFLHFAFDSSLNASMYGLWTAVLEKLIYNWSAQAGYRDGDFFQVQKMAIADDDGDSVTLEFHDTPGQEEYIPSIREHYLGTDVFIVCFKIGCLEDGKQSNATDTVGDLFH